MNTNQLVELLNVPGGKITLFILVVWSLIWKGLALWKSAQRAEKGWFVALLIINTLGILEIMYLYLFSNAKKARTTTATV